MKNNILYALSLFTLFIMAIMMLAFFYVMSYPFDLVKINKETNLNSTYKLGEELDKTLSICKNTDSPLFVTLELSNQDIIMLASKTSYAPRGCKKYVIAQNIPLSTHLGAHSLRVTACYNVHFRQICKSFISDKFQIVK